MNHARPVLMARQLIEGALVETTKLHQSDPTDDLSRAVQYLEHALEMFLRYPLPVEPPPTPLHA